MWILVKSLQALRILPLGVRVSIGRLIGSLYSMYPSRAKQIVQLQLTKFIDRETASRVSNEVFREFGQTAFESLDLSPILSNSEQLIECADWELVTKLLAQKQGIVALTAHLANWDLLAAYFCRRGLSITAIAREARDRNLQAFLTEVRAKYGVNTIWRANRAGLRLIVEQIQAANVVAALVDQDTRVAGSFVPFFGQLAFTPTSLVELGKRNKALFVSAFIVRLSKKRYRVQIRQLDGNASSEEILTNFNKHLEEIVRLYPAQWAWFHKRWQTTPAGRLSREQYLASLV